MAANLQREQTTYAERRAALVFCAVYAIVALFFAVPHALHTWRIETAIASGDLVRQEAIVVAHGKAENNRTHDLTLNLQSGRSVHVTTKFAQLTPYSKGEIVSVRLYGNDLVYVGDQYVYRAWSELWFFSLSLVPMCIIAVILLLPKVRDRRDLPRGNPSVGVTGFMGVAVGMTAGIVSLFWTHVWQVPMLVVGVTVPLIGFVAKRAWLRHTSRG